MSYELFRSTMASRLQGILPVKQIHDVLQQMDDVATQFEIKQACTDLITVTDEPEVMKMYLASLAVESKALGTVQNYRQVLKRFFMNVRKTFNTITTNDIRSYMFRYQQEEHIAKSTLDHVRSIINAFYSWLVDQEIIERNPARLIEPIRYQRNKLPPLKPIDLEYFRSSCKTAREKALIDFLFSTGCRAAECAAVKMQDVNWKDRSVTILHGKGDKQRTVYFNAEAEVSLKAYLKSKKKENDYLFNSTRYPYDGLSPVAIRREIKAIRERAEQVSVHATPHTFRRTMATTLSNSGMPIEDIQMLLGHSSLDTTMKYVTKDNQRIQASYKQYLIG